MFKSKPQKKPDFENYTSYLNEGLTFNNGTLKGVGSVKIDGIIFGDIDIDGSIIVGESGYIKGSVLSGQLQIFGKVEGDIHVHGLVQLQSGCNVQGNIECSLIMIEQNAVFCGNCNMTGKSERKKQKSEAPQDTQPAKQ